MSLRRQEGGQDRVHDVGRPVRADRPTGQMIGVEVADQGADQDVTLPDGKVLMPGMITHASNIVEHPELIAERLERYARLVGRDNVVAGADCGFSSQVAYRPEVEPRVMWAKFDALAEGARIASGRLWR